MGNQQSFGSRLLALAATVPALGTATAADAALVTIDDRPVGQSLAGDGATWDVDGDGHPEFIFRGSYTIQTTPLTYGVAGGRRNRALIYGTGFGESNQIVERDGFLKPLASSLRVGPTLNNYQFEEDVVIGNVNSFYKYTKKSYNQPTFSSTYTVISSVYNTSIFFFGEKGVSGDFNFGFRFEENPSQSGYHYGWGVINLDPSEPTGERNGQFDSARITIKEWTYSMTRNRPVHVGTRQGDVPPHSVPEPWSTLPAIALLGLGAAGVRQWRARKSA